MPMTIHVDQYYTTNIQNKPYTHQYFLRVRTVRRRDLIIARLYHRYDMLIPIRIPGWKKFERWLGTRFDAMPNALRIVGDKDRPDRLVDKLAGWTVLQDMRCYELSEKGRVLGEFEITVEDYYDFKTKRL